eukprot:CAMPEP_0185035618 /NCGR_PEP_ID=MMETSP1103-20130426/27312_1 /TAXON_ID=36769 /ORGANISM="Paraphysomonas bandaiensis, Strain Caron Lab Isolate" /LENGTH=820 /DNA_ID=CAMNT_0027572783 /DNA_START=1 /DNA_END=2463 /DNA_ORIENTATION=-
MTTTIPHDTYETAIDYGNGVRTAWTCSGQGEKNHYDAWICDGEKKISVTRDDLLRLPEEPPGFKDGEFMKGDSNLVSWKKRYFIVRGGLMTYFQDANAVKPKGTIPLNHCSLELPNDNRKSFSLKGRKDVDGFELRVSHATRRPFVLVFLTDAERRDWQKFLVKYIAYISVSKEYRLAEVISKVEGGCYVIRKPVSTDRGEMRKRYLYIDWYSRDSSEWCLRLSTIKLKLIKDPLTGQEQLDPHVSSNTLPLSTIRDVKQDDYSGYSFTVIASKDSSEFTPVVPSADTSRLWTEAIRAALLLHDACSEKSRLCSRTLHASESSRHIDDLRALLAAPSSTIEALTVPYTHEQYVKDRDPVLVEPPVSKVVRRAKSAGASSPKDASVSSFFETSTTSAADSGDPLVRQQSDSVLHPGQIHQQHDAVNNDIEPKGYPDSSTGSMPEYPLSDGDVIKRVVTKRGSSVGTLPGSHADAKYASDSEVRGRNEKMKRKGSFARLSSFVTGVLSKTGGSHSQDDSGGAVSDSDMARKRSVLGRRRLSFHRKESTHSVLKSDSLVVDGREDNPGDGEPINDPVAEKMAETTPGQRDSYSFGSCSAVDCVDDKSVDELKSSIEQSQNYSEDRSKLETNSDNRPDSCDRDDKSRKSWFSRSASSPPAECGSVKHSQLVSSNCSIPQSEADDVNKTDSTRGSSIMVEYGSVLLMLTVDCASLCIHRLQNYSNSKGRGADGDDFLFLDLSDCVAADVDLNSTGLMRLTFRTESVRRPPKFGESEPSLFQWIVRSRVGNEEAVNWMKALYHFKQESLQAKEALSNTPPDHQFEV